MHFVAVTAYTVDPTATAAPTSIVNAADLVHTATSTPSSSYLSGCCWCTCC